MKANSFLSVQYLRALAVAMVVFHHTRGPAAWLFNPLSTLNFGGGGVDLFFVISGFVIWTATRRERTVEFIQHRLIRIVPMYWCAMTVFAVVSLTGFYIPPAGYAQIVKSALFIPHYHPFITNQLWPYVIPGWSLNYEMYFYAIFACGLAIGRPMLATLVVVPLVAIAGWMAPDHLAAAEFAKNPVVFEFLLGVLIGRLNETYMRRFGALLPIGLALLCASDFTGLPWRLLSTGIQAALILIGALSVEEVIRRHPNKLLKLIGDASYSIYLFHLLAIFGWTALYQKIPVKRWTQLIGFIASAMVLAICLGLLIHVAVERPLLKWLRAWPRQRGAAVSSRGAETFP
jgi:exopolysaccharide production protein ExoZ